MHWTCRKHFASPFTDAQQILCVSPEEKLPEVTVWAAHWLRLTSKVTESLFHCPDEMSSKRKTSIPLTVIKKEAAHHLMHSCVSSFSSSQAGDPKLDSCVLFSVSPDCICKQQMHDQKPLRFLLKFACSQDGSFFCKDNLMNCKSETFKPMCTQPVAMSCQEGNNRTQALK